MCTSCKTVLNDRIYSKLMLYLPSRYLELVLWVPGLVKRKARVARYGLGRVRE